MLLAWFLKALEARWWCLHDVASYMRIASTLHAKLMAILFRLEVVKQEGIRAVGSDSVLAINEINSPSNSFPWLNIVLDIKTVCGVRCFFYS